MTTTRLQFVSFLRHTLIPDLRADERDSLAEDYETALQFITADVEALHDARKALLAASSHLIPGTNAAALVAASVKELDGILGYPAPETPAVTAPRSHSCLEDSKHLKD